MGTQVMNIPLLTEFRTLYLVLLIVYVSVCLRVYFVADFLHIECYCIYSLLLSQAVDPPAGITGMLLHTWGSVYRLNNRLYFLLVCFVI